MCGSTAMDSPMLYFRPMSACMGHRVLQNSGRIVLLLVQTGLFCLFPPSGMANSRKHEQESRALTQLNLQ